MASTYRQFSLAFLTIGCFLAPMTKAKAQPNPPTDATTELLLRAGNPNGFGCQFPVRLLLTGKGKQINLPGNRILFTSP